MLLISLFEITISQIDYLDDLIHQGIGGSGVVRMTGGGFDVVIVALVPDVIVNRLISLVENSYQKKRI